MSLLPIQDVFKQYVIDTPAGEISSEGLQAYQNKLVLQSDTQAYVNKAGAAAGTLWDEIKNNTTLMYLLIALVVIAFIKD